MAGKDSPPLYEFVHRTEKGSKRGMALPDWMRRGEDREEPAAEAESVAPPVESAEPVAAPEPAAPAPAPAVHERPERESIGERTGERFDVRQWWKSTVAFRLPRGTLVMLGTGAAVMVLIVFFVGQKLGERSASAAAQDYQRAAGTMTEFLEGRPNPNLIPPTVAGVERDPRDYADYDANVPPPPAGAGASGSAKDPREPGMNYIRLVRMPKGAPENGRIVRFLTAEGVDAAAVPDQNPEFVKIVAMRPFSRPLSDPDAGRYEERLKQLGRKWKAQHNGSSDWHDMLWEKYRPGRT